MKALPILADEPGIPNDGVYLFLGAVAAHILLPEHLFQMRAVAETMAYILPDLLLPAAVAGSAKEVPEHLLEHRLARRLVFIGYECPPPSVIRLLNP